MKRAFNEYPEISSKVIIINGDKALLIKRRLLDPYAPKRWDIPGGGSDPGEDALQTAIRELEEEIGYQASIDHIVLHNKEKIIKPNRSYHRHTFIHKSNDKFEPKLSKEHSEFKWMDIKEIEGTNLPDHYKLVCREVLSA